MAKYISMLTDQKQKQVRRQIFTSENNQVFTAAEDLADLEMMKAHFESHPTMPGEKEFKKWVNHILDALTASEDGIYAGDSSTKDWIPNIKDWLAEKYAETEIRETKFTGNKIVDMAKDPLTDPETGKTVKQYKDPEENAFRLTPMWEAYPDTLNMEACENAYVLDVELRKVKDGVNIYAKKSPDAARFTKVGSVPDNFLANNPMNVSRCPAQICIEDYSGGKLRNVSERLVVESSRMSGDYVELSDDMLTDLDKTVNLEQ